MFLLQYGSGRTQAGNKAMKPLLIIGVMLLTGCTMLPPQLGGTATPEPVPAPTDPESNETDFSLEEEVLATEPTKDTDFIQLARIPDDPVAEVVPPTEDVWARIRAGFKLAPSDHGRVVTARSWYQRHQDYLDRVATRARPYLHHIVEEIEKRDMPMEIALLPIVESAFDPYAYSHGRASGLWQFIPATGRQYGLKQNWWYDGRRDVVESTRAALDYLEYLHAYFDGDWLLALAAYNTGEGNVARAVRRNKAAGKPTDFFSLHLPAETRSYAPKLLALRDLVANPENYGIVLQSIPNEPYLDIVEIGTQVDLQLVADLSELPLTDLYLLNPGFNRWATDPEGPHRVVLPLPVVETFRAAIAAVPIVERVTWVQHRVRSGETLGGIALRYRTSVAELQRLNRLNGTMIRAGKDLLVPGATRGSRVVDAGGDGDAERVEYTVRRGDSLWKIGQEHGVGVATLAGWNAMTPSDLLRENQKLVIYLPTHGVPVGRGPMAEHTMRKINYTVRRGDSLGRISQRFRVSVNQLREWNNIDPDRYLQPGQRLLLYVDVTQQN